MEKLLPYVVSIINIIIHFIVNGFVLMKLWAWLIVPIFKIQAINFPEAIAIFIIARYLQKSNLISDHNDKMEQFKRALNNILNTISNGSLVLVFGWIMKHFI